MLIHGQFLTHPSQRPKAMEPSWVEGHAAQFRVQCVRRQARNLAGMRAMSSRSIPTRSRFIETVQVEQEYRTNTR